MKIVPSLPTEEVGPSLKGVVQCGEPGWLCLQLGSAVMPWAKFHSPQGDDGWNAGDTGSDGEGIFQGARGLKH